MILGRIKTNSQYQYVATRHNSTESGFLSGDRFNMYVDELNAPTRGYPDLRYPDLPDSGKNITIATSESLKSKYHCDCKEKKESSKFVKGCNCDNRPQDYQIRINKPYVRDNFPGILLEEKNVKRALENAKKELAEGNNKLTGEAKKTKKAFIEAQKELMKANKEAKKALRNLINYSMIASGHYFDRSKAADDQSSDSFLSEEFPPIVIIKHKVKLLRLGVRWEVFMEWAEDASNFPDKLLFSVSGLTRDDCSATENDAKEKGAQALKSGIQKFFTFVPSLSATTTKNTKTFMHKFLGFIKDKYTDFKAGNNKIGEETYEEELDKNDPLDDLLTLEEKETRSKLFVLIFCLIQRGNISRIFGDMKGAKTYLDYAEKILVRHDDTIVQARPIDVPNHLAKVLNRIYGNEADKELSEANCRSLRIRLDIVRAQLVRQIAKKTIKNGGWNTKELMFLLQRIKVETRDRQGYEISNRFARFQQLMCRLYALHDICKSSDTSSASSSSISPEFERKMVILELEALENEYGEKIEAASKDNDEAAEYFNALHQQFVKAEILNFKSEKLHEITPQKARDEWWSMLNDRKKILGIDHRHTIYAQHKYAKLCAKLDSNLDEAIKQVESAICYQKDEGWKVGTLIPTYGNLCLKAKRKLGEAIEKVSYGIDYQKDPDKKAELERLLGALTNEVEPQSGTSSKRKRGNNNSGSPGDSESKRQRTG